MNIFVNHLKAKTRKFAWLIRHYPTIVSARLSEHGRGLHRVHLDLYWFVKYIVKAFMVQIP